MITVRFLSNVVLQCHLYHEKSILSTLSEQNNTNAYYHVAYYLRVISPGSHGLINFHRLDGVESHNNIAYRYDAEVQHLCKSEGVAQGHFQPEKSLEKA